MGTVYLNASIQTERRDHRWIWHILSLLALIALTLMFWLPFGFNIGAQEDTWNISAGIMEGIGRWYDPGYIPTRPLSAWAWLIAWMLTPDSFVGLNIVMAAGIALKGMLAYALARQVIPDSLGIALAFGALAILHPADANIFYLDAINIHLSLVGVFAAVNLLVWSWRLTGWRRGVTLIAACAVQLWTLGTYEAGVPLLFFAPPILLMLPHPPSPSPRREGESGLGREVIRRWLITTAIWMIPLAIWGVAFAAAYFSGQSSYFTGLAGNISSRREYVERLFVGYRHTLIDSLPLGVTTLDRTDQPATLIALSVVAGIGFAALIGRSNGQLKGKPRRWLVILAAGFAAVGLGLLFYLPTTMLISYYFRAYYYASIGGAIVLLALAGWIGSRFGRGAFAVIVGIMIGVFALRHLIIHDIIVDRWWQMRENLADIVRAVPDPAPHTLILVLDSAERPIHESVPYNLHFYSALRMVYNDFTLIPWLCWDDQRPEISLRQTCTFEADALDIPGLWVGDWRTPYDRVLVLEYNGDEAVIVDTLPVDAPSYDPAARIESDTFPPRMASMLES